MSTMELHVDLWRSPRAEHIYGRMFLQEQLYVLSAPSIYHLILWESASIEGRQSTLPFTHVPSAELISTSSQKSYLLVYH